MVGVGVIGAGAISAHYLEHLRSYPDLAVHMIGDLEPERAAARAAQFGVACFGSADDVLRHPDIELVVNLTVPAAHAEVSSRALGAGMHVWSEKPIGVSRDESDALIRQARATGLRIGVAPDTLLGRGMQSVRRFIDRGEIGEPLAALTLMQTAGPQRGHPNPEFLFQRGAGPLFDFGPYYLTALATVFGSFSRVAAVGTRARDTRVIGSGPRAGTVFPVSVPTNVALIAEFVGGAMSQSSFSFDAQLHRVGFFEIYGSEATLSIPDPNRFTGRIRRAVAPSVSASAVDDTVWTDLPETGIMTGRGLGVLDMARAIREGRPHVAGAELGAHVLDVLVSAEDSIAAHRFVEVESRIDPVPTLPYDFDPFLRTL